MLRTVEKYRQARERRDISAMGRFRILVLAAATVLKTCCVRSRRYENINKSFPPETCIEEVCAGNLSPTE